MTVLAYQIYKSRETGSRREKKKGKRKSATSTSPALGVSSELEKAEGGREGGREERKEGGKDGGREGGQW